MFIWTHNRLVKPVKGHNGMNSIKELKTEECKEQVELDFPKI